VSTPDSLSLICNKLSARFAASISRPVTTALGTKFALVTGGNAVVQLDDKFNVKFRVNRSRSWLALADQQRVPTGGSFRATEKFSLPRFHKAAARLAMPHPHYRHWRRESLSRLCSESRQPPVPASGQTNFLILETSWLLFAKFDNVPMESVGRYLRGPEH